MGSGSGTEAALHLTFGGGAFMSASVAGGAALNDPHCFPSRPTTHLLLFSQKNQPCLQSLLTFNVYLFSETAVSEKHTKNPN